MARERATHQNFVHVCSDLTYKCTQTNANTQTHRLNIKRLATGLPAVVEDEFQRIVSDLEDGAPALARVRVLACLYRRPKDLFAYMNIYRSFVYGCLRKRARKFVYASDYI